MSSTIGASLSAPTTPNYFRPFLNASPRSLTTAANWLASPGAIRRRRVNGARPPVRSGRRLTPTWTGSRRFMPSAAKRAYAEIDGGLNSAAMWLTLFAALGVLASITILLMSRGVVHPLSEITRVTEVVAKGNDNIAIPFRDRATRSAHWRARSAFPAGDAEQ